MPETTPFPLDRVFHHMRVSLGRRFVKIGLSGDVEEGGGQLQVGLLPFSTSD